MILSICRMDKYGIQIQSSHRNYFIQMELSMDCKIQTDTLTH